MTDPPVPALLEIATREDTRPRIGGRPAVPRWALLAPLPAALAVLAVLVRTLEVRGAVSLGGHVVATVRLKEPS